MSHKATDLWCAELWKRLCDTEKYVQETWKKVKRYSVVCMEACNQNALFSFTSMMAKEDNTALW